MRLITELGFIDFNFHLLDLTQPVPCSSQEVAVTSQDAGTKRGSPREEIWSWAESHESDLGSQAGGRARCSGDAGTWAGGFAPSRGVVVQPHLECQEWQGRDQRVTLCPRVGTGSSWGGPEDTESRGCCSTKDDEFRGAVPGGTLSHRAEACQGVPRCQ